MAGGQVAGGSVLISGAGVAGPALAWWLLRAGFTPVLVEAAPAARGGGYMIDFWGPGFDVAERMGLAPRLRQIGYRIGELRLVDGRGGVVTRLSVGAATASLGDRYVSLQRGDLAHALLDRLEGEVETVFGDEITGLVPGDQHVAVSFRRAAPRRFDLVIGADGLHSKVRRLAFPEPAEVPLGLLVAAFTADNYPHRDPDAFVSRATVGRQAARYSLRGGRTAFFMVVAADLAKGRPLAAAADQRAFIEAAFAGVGAEAGDMIAALRASRDFYFDEVSQTRIPAWSRGRVAVVGDAAYAPSLLAGEGASLAMVGAYVLAGELAAAAGDHRAAFAAYERRLRPFIERRQKSALRMCGWFAPRTRAGLFVRNQLTRLAGLPGISGLLLRPMIGDAFSLPDYPWRPAGISPGAGLAAPAARQRG